MSLLFYEKDIITENIKIPKNAIVIGIEIMPGNEITYEEVKRILIKKNYRITNPRGDYAGYKALGIEYKNVDVDLVIVPYSIQNGYYITNFNGLEERLNARINPESLENLETLLEFVYKHLRYKIFKK